MQFKWNELKADSNFKKHGVAFAEAETVFGDSLARIFDDDEHSFDEKRNGIFGRSIKKSVVARQFCRKRE